MRLVTPGPAPAAGYTESACRSERRRRHRGALGVAAAPPHRGLRGMSRYLLGSIVLPAGCEGLQGRWIPPVFVVMGLCGVASPSLIKNAFSALCHLPRRSG